MSNAYDQAWDEQIDARAAEPRSLVVPVHTRLMRMSTEAFERMLADGLIEYRTTLDDDTPLLWQDEGDQA